MQTTKDTIDFHGTCENAEPWLEAGDLPYSFSINKTGVYRESGKDKDEKHSELICGPLWIAARTRGTDGNNHGMLVKWLDRDGELHERCIKQSRLHDQSTALAQDLADSGLHITPGKEGQLKTYLASSKPDLVLQSVERLGWSKDRQGKPAFVRPTETITGTNANEQILFQPQSYCPAVAAMTAKGDLEGYKKDVIERLVDQPILLFFLLSSLSAPLLKNSATENGGFHIHGETTGGKTTGLQIAASVWGSGADPQRRPEDALCQTWNSTANGLEGIAAAHNDLPLCFDEIGKFIGDNFSEVVYNIIGGTGKARMTAEIAHRKPNTWRTLFLSTGEISIADRIKQDGKKMKDGQAVRIVDIPVGDSLILGLDTKAAAELSDTLKNAVTDRNYGVLGPAFIKALLTRCPDEEALSREIADLVLSATESLKKGIGVEIPQRVARVLKRFALVLATGYLAQDLLNLPLTQKQIEQSAVHVMNLWLGNGTALISETDQAIEHFQAFLQENQHRFAEGNPVGGLAQLSRTDIGYKLPGFLCLTKAGFAEACGSWGIEKVRGELLKRGFLTKTEPDRWETKVLLGGKQQRLYKVDIKILED
ncbi:MAG: DUF927 domain-containing protein [Candidatus Obscuribacter sp.]|nr:DUF927 domain-containing protein [Candidatus Obscuribacter sp.]